MTMARILLVVYDNALRDSIATVLERERDLEVIGQAGSVAECRTFVSSGQGFDVAIVGLALPDGDATELIGDLRGANPDASVLATSSGPQDHARARAAGADEVVSVASSMEELVEAVGRLARP
jgi:two-component system, NarL family, response regulator DevR